MSLNALSGQRRKLLELYYAGKISADGFKEEEDRLSVDIEAARLRALEEMSTKATLSELEERFEEVARILANLDISAVWQVADERERRVLVEELIQWVTVFPDHLEVSVIGAPPLNVLYPEVGLHGSEIVGVGGPT
jgi:biotin synthase-related radical SAM superfamily protein